MNVMHSRIRHVLLDRDGVLNVERSDHRHIHDWSEWQWVAGAREGLAQLSRAGVHISVVTNQSGIGRGSMTRGKVDTIHAHMLEEAAQAGGIIDRVLVCPHAPNAGCACRKPLPGLVLEAIEASGVPRNATLAVGDDLRDLQAAWAADISAVLVRTGKGRSSEALIQQGRVKVFDDLRAFAETELSNDALGLSASP